MKGNTVNQQILAAIKFGISQNKVIWRLPRLCHLHMLAAKNTQFTKCNSTPKFIDLQYEETS